MIEHVNGSAKDNLGSSLKNMEPAAIETPSRGMANEVSGSGTHAGDRLVGARHSRWFV